MPRGGARPNSGPPKNPLVKTSREAMVDATKAVGLTPAQVFAENLRFWYDIAVNLTDKITSALDDPGFVAAFQEDPELLRELNTNIKNMMAARQKAQECAVDMAPYRHPRLGQIEVTPAFGDEPPDEGVPRITQKTDPKIAAAIYEQSLRMHR